MCLISTRSASPLIDHNVSLVIHKGYLLAEFLFLPRVEQVEWGPSHQWGLFAPFVFFVKSGGKYQETKITFVQRLDWRSELEYKRKCHLDKAARLWLKCDELYHCGVEKFNRLCSIQIHDELHCGFVKPWVISASATSASATMFFPNCQLTE